MSAPSLRLSTLGRRVLGRYRGAGSAARLFLNARWRWTPYEQIAGRLAPQGLMLDLGSGHGLLSLAMGLSEPRRTIRGIDHDPRRVRLARQAAAGLTNVEFATGNVLDAVADPSLCGTVAGIVVMDMIHYLPYAEQELFLARCRVLLQHGGDLLIRDVDADAGKSFVINRVHERVMTSLGFTRGERLNFRSRGEWLRVLAGAGFQAASEPCSRFPFADLLFHCRLAPALAARAA